jgi:ABC-type sulfate transport system permease component
MSVLVSTLAAVNEPVQLPFAPIVFGIIAAVVFISLGFVTWSYRDVANRHPQKSAKFASTHDVHGHADRTGADH